VLARWQAMRTDIDASALRTVDELGSLAGQRFVFAVVGIDRRAARQISVEHVDP
jgi:hypothetical protein